MRPLIALLLAGCASQAPDVLNQAKAAVDGRASYANYTGWDRRVLQVGDKGNCVAFAYSYYDEAQKRGVPLMMRSCTLRNGEEHAFVFSLDGWALDVRHDRVVPLSEVGCR